MSKGLCCTPCPIGSPFLKPSNLAEGWPGSSKIAAQMRIHGSQSSVPGARWELLMRVSEDTQKSIWKHVTSVRTFGVLSEKPNLN